MKKLLLLLAATGAMYNAGAQALTHSGPFLPMKTKADHAIQPVRSSSIGQHHHAQPKNDEKTTSTFSLWYEYAVYMNTTGTVAASFPYMWNDTSSLDAYGNGSGGIEYDHNTMVCIGTTFDPYFAGWGSAYSASAVLSPTQAYTIDSVAVYGAYGTNPAKTGVVDTLIIGYLYGTGYHWRGGAPSSDVFESEFDNSFASSVLSDYSVASTDTLWFPEMIYDSVTNTANGLTYGEQKVLLRNASGVGTNNYFGWYDTLNGGTNFKEIGLTTPINVPAGDVVGFSITFKTGDPSYNPATLTLDTVFATDGSTYAKYNYNMWRPELVNYGTATTPLFWTYNPADLNGGLFKELPNYQNGWDNLFLPNYAWTSGGNASNLQYPTIDYHLTATTTTTSTATPAIKTAANQVKVYPNPASNVVTVAYKLGAAANVSVTLTDMLGQVVVTQNIDNSSEGKATINTSGLAAGIYLYTVIANGEHTTGRVVISH